MYKPSEHYDGSGPWETTIQGPSFHHLLLLLLLLFPGQGPLCSMFFLLLTSGTFRGLGWAGLGLAFRITWYGRARKRTMETAEGTAFLPVRDDLFLFFLFCFCSALLGCLLYRGHGKESSHETWLATCFFFFWHGIYGFMDIGLDFLFFFYILLSYCLCYV